MSPAFCRRDDYAYLPPQATSGVSCGGAVATPNPVVDPRQIALAKFNELALPSLRLNMNPRRGMVAVPTWFWVEGYDGGVIPLTDNLELSHEECQQIVDVDADGHFLLDATGAPITRRDCTVMWDTLTVEVRVWPQTFVWNFGDATSKVVRCPDVAACPQGIGVPFTDVHTPSPIAHTYRWSSLDANGTADAYTISLGVNFGAQYRFSTNGVSMSGWQTLASRDLSWTASHQVQEAQSVLTRP